MLTYVDEDGDSVALVDDDDLNDVAKQSPNPLRITVKLNAEKTGALPPPMWVICLNGIPLERSFCFNVLTMMSLKRWKMHHPSYVRDL